MADSGDRRRFIYNLHEQSKPVGAVRWLPSVSPFLRLAAMSVLSPPAIEIHSFSSQSPNPNPDLNLVSSYPLPSSATSLTSFKSHNYTLIAASTSTGSLHIFSVNPYDGKIESQIISISDKDSFHCGPIQSIDVETSSTGECATAGEDGRVNLVLIGEDKVENFRVCESDGLVAYSAVKWGSPVEFVTGGVGPGLQWWDKRRPGGPVAQFKGVWGRGTVTGMIHSIDIHPSRKHTCVVGGSSGAVYAWDLRWQQQAITLAGTGLEAKSQPFSESEVWEVKYDAFTPQVSSTKVLPVMMCSEDGFLAVLQQDERPVQLLEEPCAINSFDIDPQNPSDVIVALEWESVGILSRGREETEMA
ncbi:Nucleoporin Nup43 [Rhynchospora pubera]|uniref:Nucleoporin Nup43 n=1 Tax=Rhynchospora pubera TaxID=906938 RepID=A0AAV8ES08_9POAL|nr:Nucleoporin Nup43 [Rhynchospora pubera]